MPGNHPRIVREKNTVKTMIKIYCKAHHGGNKELCSQCHEFLEYAKMRLDKCPYQEKKSTCAKCLTHCYNESMRMKVKTVMRYSGPRMLARHPILAFLHIIDGFKRPKKRKRNNP